MKYANRSQLSKLAIITATLGFAATAQAATGVFEESIDASEAVTVEITTTAGDVVVQGADVGQVTVRGVIRVDDKVASRDPIRASNLIRSVRSTPPVEVVDGRLIVGELKRRTHQRHLQISYVITVPSHLDVTARSISGDVRVSGVRGLVKATSETGKVVRAEINDDAGDQDRA